MTPFDRWQQWRRREIGSAIAAVLLLLTLVVVLWREL